MIRHDDFYGYRAKGYETREGNYPFDYNPQEAQVYLKKAFEKHQWPDLANVLGYSCYYGEANNGKIDEDGAFKYFSIGNILGSVESSYKLADCYIHGYGTMVSYDAAYKLIESHYDDELYNLKCGNVGSKFTDIALRLASYYENGYGIEQDLDRAYEEYLKAHAALRYRLEKMNYLGDSSVAFRLDQSINRIKFKLGIEEKERTGKTIPLDIRRLDGVFGYSYNYKLELKDDHTLVIHSKQPMILLAPEYSCSKYVEECDYIIKVKEKIGITVDKIYHIESHKENNILEIIFVDYEDKDFTVEECYASIEGYEFDRQYQLVSVSFNNSDKTYEYLYLGDKDIGPTAIVETSRGEQITKVVSSRKIYEDQLPIPLFKMKKCR